jgi:hypothetical protein
MQLGAVPYVHNKHQQHIKLHEHHYFTYIQMIESQMLQNGMQNTYLVLVHKPVYYDIHTQYEVWRYLIYS